MKISYDPKVDAMYIRFRNGRYDHTKKITDEIIRIIGADAIIIGALILGESLSPKKRRGIWTDMPIKETKISLGISDL